MAKRKSKSPIEGRWEIVSMTEWDMEYIEEELQPFIEFERTLPRYPASPTMTA